MHRLLDQHCPSPVERVPEDLHRHLPHEKGGENADERDLDVPACEAFPPQCSDNVRAPGVRITAMVPVMRLVLAWTKHHTRFLSGPVVRCAGSRIGDLSRRIFDAWLPIARRCRWREPDDRKLAYECKVALVGPVVCEPGQLAQHASDDRPHEAVTPLVVGDHSRSVFVVEDQGLHVHGLAAHRDLGVTGDLNFRYQSLVLPHPDMTAVRRLDGS